MSTDSPDEHDELPPPGSRWGTGAQSVLPYLTRTLRAKPATAPEAREARAREDNAGGAERNPAVRAG